MNDILFFVCLWILINRCSETIESNIHKWFNIILFLKDSELRVSFGIDAIVCSWFRFFFHFHYMLSLPVQFYSDVYYDYTMKIWTHAIEHYWAQRREKSINQIQLHNLEYSSYMLPFKTGLSCHIRPFSNSEIRCNIRDLTLLISLIGWNIEFVPVNFCIKCILCTALEPFRFFSILKNLETHNSNSRWQNWSEQKMQNNFVNLRCDLFQIWIIDQCANYYAVIKDGIFFI